MFIDLDLGTSSLKAKLINEHQVVLAEHSVSLTVQRLQEGWSEQDPQSWCDAAMEALKAVTTKVDCSGVRGLGLSGHMHGATLVGTDDQVLRPCMLWYDTRSQKQASAMDGGAAFRDLTGNIVFLDLRPQRSIGYAKTNPRFSRKPPRFCCLKTTCACS